MVCSGLDIISIDDVFNHFNKNKALSIIKYFEKWKLCQELKDMYIRLILDIIDGENTNTIKIRVPWSQTTASSYVLVNAWYA